MHRGMLCRQDQAESGRNFSPPSVVQAARLYSAKAGRPHHGGAVAQKTAGIFSPGPGIFIKSLSTDFHWGRVGATQTKFSRTHGGTGSMCAFTNLGKDA